MEIGVHSSWPNVFTAHPAIVTVAVMAPTKTRQLLGGSGDPLYDLCNPPPITLVSRSGSVSSKKNPESLADQKLDNLVFSTIPKTPEESPAYMHRSVHPDGNIIVTADYTGRIKVFRQDCAYIKRKNESWETSSTFSKKIGSSIFSGHGRRSSQSHTHPGSDRILSWRQSIASNGSLEGSIRGNRSSAGLDGASSGRSISPRKSMGAMSIGSGSTTHRFMRSGSVRSRATSIGVDASTNGQGAYGRINGPNHGHSSPASASTRRPSLDEEIAESTGLNHNSLVMTQETNRKMRHYDNGVPRPRAESEARPHRLSVVDSNESTDDIYSSDDESGESETETVRCKRFVSNIRPYEYRTSFTPKWGFLVTDWSTVGAGEHPSRQSNRGKGNTSFFASSELFFRKLLPF